MRAQAKPQIRVSGWTEIPWALFQQDAETRTRVMQRITRDLVFTTADTRDFTGSDRDSRDRIALYENVESGDFKVLRVPRYYLERIQDLVKPGAAEWENIIDARATGIGGYGNSVSQIGMFTGPTYVEFTKNPKLQLKTDPGKNQVEGSAALQDAMGGILVAAPGKGKTVMAIHAACAIGRRTLIVVPTQALLDQWVQRIQDFTNLTRGEIGIVQGDTCQWNRPFIVAMVHSLSQKEYPAELYRSVGVFITDEVHRIGAPTWLQVVPRFPAMYRWGLSATPERPDGMHKAFMLHIGEIVYEMLELDSQPTVYQVLTGTQLPQRAISNSWNGRTNFSKMYTSLSRDLRRNNLLAQEILNCWRAGRKVLVLSKRIMHLQALYHLAMQKGIPVEDMGTISGPEKMKGDRKRILTTRKVIFAIEQIAGLGLDQPDLDTLIWATPSQAVEQNVGRIERVDVPKKSPLAIDPVDDVPMLVRLAKARLKKFRQRGYKVLVVDRKSYGR